MRVPFPTLRCGDIVEAPMRIKLPERYRDPGAWQYADYLLAQGIGAHASVRASKIALLNEPDASLATTTDRAAQLQCKIYAAQSWASRRVLGYVHSKANRRLPKLLPAQSRRCRNVERNAVRRPCRIEQDAARRL